VLCDSLVLERWQASALRELVSNGDADPVAILTTNRKPNEPAERAGGLFKKVVQPSQRARAESIHDLLRTGAKDMPDIDLDGTDFRDELTALGLDFILYLGFDRSDARLARHAEHGLWRFKFGEGAKYDNYPPGVWEILAGDPVTAAALYAQMPDSETARVLRSGVYATIAHRSNANADQVLEDSAHWPAYAARRIGQELWADDLGSIDLPPATIPHLPPLSFRIRLAARLLMNKLARLPNLFLDDSWNVGLVDEPIQNFLAPSASRRATWFPNHDRNFYFADPMGATVNGRSVVLCESYDFRTELGSISALGIDDDKWTSVVTPVMQPKLHTSYPFLLTADGELYCVPETSQAGEAVLYRFTEFPARYQAAKCLLSGNPYLDPTLLKHADRWWLFCTSASDGEHSKLHVWYADDLFGEFLPHPLNPVKIDVRSSRPAGTPFTFQGRLYRPSQDCSRTYGGAVTINEIMELSPTAFHERPVASVRPLSGSGYEFGLHTLSRFGDMTLIDSKRRLFTGRGLREKTSSILKRMFTKR
jgi:hypothetical protein